MLCGFRGRRQVTAPIALDAAAHPRQHRIVRPLLIGLLLLAAVYLLLIAAAWAWQERIAWQPPRGADDAGTAAQRIAYAAADGQPLYAYLVGDPARSAGVLVAFPGNAQLAGGEVPRGRGVAQGPGWARLPPP